MILLRVVYVPGTVPGIVLAPSHISLIESQVQLKGSTVQLLAM